MFRDGSNRNEINWLWHHDMENILYYWRLYGFSYKGQAIQGLTDLLVIALKAE